jgi:ribosomal protein S18 acetylase RimI-like enzyme
MLLALAAALVNIRPAVLSDPVDGEALCAVRAPTQYVVEDGGVGFMGKRV